MRERVSEDEAFRRVSAARLVKRFPALLDALASGELHLTGLLMLGPHLTEANLAEVLARVKHRTKREIARLVRVLDPLPNVPARIEPLGPALARPIPTAPTWEGFVQSLCPVRELAAGERPRDWMDGANDTGDLVTAGAGSPPDDALEQPPSSLEAHRFRVQFTATAEYVRLIEEAQALLSHAVRQATFVEIQLCAMRAFVASLKKRKHAARNTQVAPPELGGEAPREPEPSKTPERTEFESQPLEPAELPRRRGRHLPAAVRRAVFARDQGRCSYVDTEGHRCRETQRLEFHHLDPFALGGGHNCENVALRCRAHNVLAAEADFGRRFMQEKSGSLYYEPFSRQIGSE